MYKKNGKNVDFCRKFGYNAFVSEKDKIIQISG